MKPKIWIALPVLAALCTSAPEAGAQVRAALSFTEQGLDGFFLSIGEHYRVPRERVVWVHERKIPREEIPVVFFIAREARVTPEKVVALRLKGHSWQFIAMHYRLRPDVFLVKGVKAHGPYARVYDHIRGKEDWKHVRFTDFDAVNCVNLRFLTERHRCSPERIMVWRDRSRSFHDMDRDLRGPHRLSQEHPSDTRVARKDTPSKQRDRGRNAPPRNGWNEKDNKGPRVDPKGR